MNPIASETRDLCLNVVRQFRVDLAIDTKLGRLCDLTMIELEVSKALTLLQSPLIDTSEETEKRFESVFGLSLHLSHNCLELPRLLSNPLPKPCRLYRSPL